MTYTYHNKPLPACLFMSVSVTHIVPHICKHYEASTVNWLEGINTFVMVNGSSD